MAQRKFYEAEADVEARTLEKKNSDFAFQEIKQEFESQRFNYTGFRSRKEGHSQDVDRYTSHVIFLMQFAQFISCISHCMAQVSLCARHSVYMSSMMCV